MSPLVIPPHPPLKTGNEPPASQPLVHPSAIQRVTYAVAGQAVAVHVTNDPVSSNNGFFYLYTDHLGSTTLLRKRGTSAILSGSTAYYLPFGSYRPDSTTPTQTITDKGFTGQKENMELGLMYYNARFYAPGLGRFITADTIVPDPTSPQSYNRYSYTYNNPINHIDPSGHDSWWCGDDLGCLVESNRSMANRTLSKLSGQYFCTDGYGCFDIHHVNPRRVFNLRNDMKDGQATISGYLQKFTYQVRFEATYGVSASLTGDQEAAVITGMLYDYERRWEEMQGDISFGAGRSSYYSPEDLPSDHIGIYIGIHYPLSAYDTEGELLETFAEVAATYLGGAHPASGVPHPRENVNSTRFGSIRIQNREFLPFVETSTGWGNVSWPNALQLTPMESNGSTWEFQSSTTCEGWGCFE